MSIFDLDNTNNEKEFHQLSQIDTDIIALDVPNGWSSICLNDTITYYIECNKSIVKNKNDLNTYE